MKLSFIIEGERKTNPNLLQGCKAVTPALQEMPEGLFEPKGSYVQDGAGKNI